MLTFTRDASFPIINGRLLIVICSYRGWNENLRPFSISNALPLLGKIGRLFDCITLLKLRQFIAANRDFFANPRPLIYQISLIKELLKITVPDQVTIIIDHAFQNDPALSSLESLGNSELCMPANFVSHSANVDAVVIVYPDAIGLGWSGLESQILGLSTYLLNGRRRMQALDAKIHRQLRWHRVLASARFPELLMSIAIIPIAAILASLDALNKKS